MKNREQMLKIIIKLIDLTKDKKIQWKIDYNFNKIVFPHQILQTAFITELEGKKLRLYSISNRILNSLMTTAASGFGDINEEIKLEMYDDDNNININFPDSIDLITLYDLVKKNNLGVDNWINNILKNS